MSRQSLSAGYAAAWLGIGAVVTGAIYLLQRTAPIADLLTAFAAIALFHDVGLFAVVAAFAGATILAASKRTVSPNIEAIKRSMFVPFAGLVGAMVFFTLTLGAIMLPPWIPLIDAHRLAGLP